MRLTLANLNLLRAAIGLEIHAQLNTQTKLFSKSKYSFNSPPNSIITPFDVALPGTLPSLNKSAVILAVRAALALNCRVNLVSWFDRKHYFYPDLPAGYQITQYDQPIACDGHFEYLTKPNNSSSIASSVAVMTDKCEIQRVQLEQDSGKSLYQAGTQNEGGAARTLVDFNRAGVALIEIVTGVNFSSGAQASDFVAELRDLLRQLGVCRGQMERGELRVDANVSLCEPPASSSSVSPSKQQFGVRTEIKNINSLRAVCSAIDFEIDRQRALIREGHSVENQTRFWDPIKEQTVATRDKETFLDYRYIHETNLPPLHLNEVCPLCTPSSSSKTNSADSANQICVNCITQSLPAREQMHHFMRRHLVVDLALPLYQVDTLLRERSLFDLFVRACRHLAAPLTLCQDDSVGVPSTSFSSPSSSSSASSAQKEAAAWISGALLGVLRQRNLIGSSNEPKDSSEFTSSCSEISLPFPEHQLFELIKLKIQQRVSAQNTRKILEMLFDSPEKTPLNLMVEFNFEENRDEQEIYNICSNYIASNPKAIRDHLAGKKRINQFFVKRITEQNKSLNSQLIEKSVDAILSEHQNKQ